MLPAYPRGLGRAALWFCADNKSEGVGVESGAYRSPQRGEMRGAEGAYLVSGQAWGRRAQEKVSREVRCSRLSPGLSLSHSSALLTGPGCVCSALAHFQHSECTPLGFIRTSEPE